MDYQAWKAEGAHLKEYAAEMLGTAALLFAVVGFVALWFSPLSPLRHLPVPEGVRPFLAGACIGGSGALIAVSPPGRLSGAHLNPMISLGFLLLGKMHLRDFVGYVLSQMVGGVLGTLAAAWAFGPAARSVADAALGPGAGVGALACAAGEFTVSLVYAYAIYACVSDHRLLRWTPLVSVALTSLLVGTEARVSGAGFNPARWLGPALLASAWRDTPAYVLTPLVGGALAAALRRLAARHPVPHTGKLFHDPSFRSIFRHDHVASRVPEAAVKKR